MNSSSEKYNQFEENSDSYFYIYHHTIIINLLIFQLDTWCIKIIMQTLKCLSNIYTIILAYLHFVKRTK